MKKIKISHFAIFILSLLSTAFVGAVPSSDSPYHTDPQYGYVQDATSESIGGVNMILCIIKDLNINGSGMLNVGPYIALLDVKKCEPHNSGGSDSSGASSATNYMTAVVDAKRASNNDPMISHIWMSISQNGEVNNIHLRLSATQSPTDVPPYGVFRLDYIGKDGSSVTGFNGYIDSTPGELQFYETGPSSSNIALSMTAGSVSSGSGTITTVSPATTFNFNYNSNYFRRSDGTNDQCFDRSKANAAKSAWRYGTYNAIDGSRLDQSNPSFQISATYDGDSHYGSAGYYGIDLQGLDLNSISDASPIAGLTITDQRPGNTTSYQLSKVSGKLTKWTQHATTLSAIDGIPFYFNGDLSGKTSDNNVTGHGNWQMQWNNSTAKFTVIGTQVCHQNGCVPSTLSIPATVNSGALDDLTLSGWSDSFGGNITIPALGNDHVSSDPLYFFSQSLVLPGSESAPTALYCLNNCPTAESVNAVNGYTSGTTPSPYDATTASQWNSAPSLTDTVSYTYSGDGLLESDTSMIMNNPAFFHHDPTFQHGVMSGKLFTEQFASCTSSGTAVCEPSAPTVYYTWSTGTNQWNQSLWLTKTNDGSIVDFDPPQLIAYSVPNEVEYGTWAGKNIQLQFNGFGNLYGIPGYCVNSVDNNVTDCSESGVRYVPMFSIPDGANLTMPDNTPVIVKAMEAEFRLKDLGAGATERSTMSLTPRTPPSGDVHDMTDPADAYYMGVKPVVTDSPKVIDGIVQ